MLQRMSANECIKKLSRAAFKHCNKFKLFLFVKTSSNVSQTIFSAHVGVC